MAKNSQKNIMLNEIRGKISKRLFAFDKTSSKTASIDCSCRFFIDLLIYAKLIEPYYNHHCGTERQGKFLLYSTMTNSQKWWKIIGTSFKNIQIRFSP